MWFPERRIAVSVGIKKRKGGTSVMLLNERFTFCSLRRQPSEGGTETRRLKERSISVRFIREESVKCGREEVVSEGEESSFSYSGQSGECGGRLLCACV